MAGRADQHCDQARDTVSARPSCLVPRLEGHTASLGTSAMPALSDPSGDGYASLRTKPGTTSGGTPLRCVPNVNLVTPRLPFPEGCAGVYNRQLERTTRSISREVIAPGARGLSGKPARCSASWIRTRAACSVPTPAKFRHTQVTPEPTWVAA